MDGEVVLPPTVGQTWWHVSPHQFMQPWVLRRAKAVGAAGSSPGGEVQHVLHG